MAQCSCNFRSRCAIIIINTIISAQPHSCNWVVPDNNNNNVGNNDAPCFLGTIVTWMCIVNCSRHLLGNNESYIIHKHRHILPSDNCRPSSVESYPAISFSFIPSHARGGELQMFRRSCLDEMPSEGGESYGDRINKATRTSTATVVDCTRYARAGSYL